MTRTIVIAITSFCVNGQNVFTLKFPRLHVLCQMRFPFPVSMTRLHPYRKQRPRDPRQMQRLLRQRRQVLASVHCQE